VDFVVFTDELVDGINTGAVSLFQVGDGLSDHFFKLGVIVGLLFLGR